MKFTAPVAIRYNDNMDELSTIIYPIMHYIHLWCPLIALIVSLFRSRLFGRFSLIKFAEQFFLQLLFWVVGIQGLLVFVLLTWFPEMSKAISINVTTISYLFNLAVVNLSIGIVGIVSLLSSLGFQTATALIYCIASFGAGIGHLHNILAGIEPYPHYSSVVYADIVIPLIILVVLMVTYQNQKSKH